MSFCGGISRSKEEKGEEEEEVLRNERREWGRGWWLCNERVCRLGGEPFLAIWKREREREREGERGFGGEGVLRFNFQSIDTAYGFCLKYSKF